MGETIRAFKQIIDGLKVYEITMIYQLLNRGGGRKTGPEPLKGGLGGGGREIQDIKHNCILQMQVIFFPPPITMARVRRQFQSKPSL